MTYDRFRRPVALGALLAVVLAAVVLVSPSGAAVAPPTSGPARDAAAWLDRLASVSVPLKGFDGTSDDWGVTLDAALGLVAAGAPDTTVDRVWVTLVAQRDAAVAPGGVDNPGRLARAVMFAVAIGQDPRAVGVAPGADLVARLEGLRTTTGRDAGLYGAADPTFDGAFRQAYALMALVAAGAPVPPDAVAWLTAQQCADGAWMPYRSDLTVACARNDALFVGPDSNSTASAVEALAAVRSGDAARAAGVEWLWRNRGTDGGWGFFPGDDADPNSTALVVQALLAVGGAADARYTAGPVTPPEALAAFQLGCDRPVDDRGALTFPGSGDAPNSFATAQAVPALAGVAFPLAVTAAGAPFGPVDCTTTTTTTTTEPDTSAPDTTVADPTTTSIEIVNPSPTFTASTTAPTAPAPTVLGVSATRTPDAAGAALATTGTTSLPVVLAGAALLLAGLVLSLVAARRR